MPKETNSRFRTKIPTTLNVLLVAAGGAGSINMPGKGGQVLEFTANVSVGRNFIITVGNGANNSDGEDTSAFGVTALGGGYENTGFAGNGVEGVSSVITGSLLTYGTDGTETTQPLVDGSGNGGCLALRGCHGVAIVSYPAIYSPFSVIGEYTVTVSPTMRVYTITANSIVFF